MKDWIKATDAPIMLATIRSRGACADCVVTDTWFSMGDKDRHRHNLLKPYQVNAG